MVNWLQVECLWVIIKQIVPVWSIVFKLYALESYCLRMINWFQAECTGIFKQIVCVDFKKNALESSNIDFKLNALESSNKLSAYDQLISSWMSWNSQTCVMNCKHPMYGPFGTTIAVCVRNLVARRAYCVEPSKFWCVFVRPSVRPLFFESLLDLEKRVICLLWTFLACCDMDPSVTSPHQSQKS